MQPRVLLDGLAMPESPRWHDGRLWFSNWGARQIVAVDLDGNSEVVGVLTADWRGTEAVEDVIKARPGQVLAVDAPAPGVGWP